MRINTNISSLNYLVKIQQNQDKLSESLTRLSTGLRINYAKDDASGMAISNIILDSANTLGQASNNANDAVAMLQIADKAIDEQMKILDLIKVKATQAAQDGQNVKTRTIIQNEIDQLLKEFDSISNNTTYNDINLLNGSFVNKKFQIGSNSNQMIQASISSTNSNKIGNTRFETSSNIVAGNYGNIDIKINSSINHKEYIISNINIGFKNNQGLGNLVNEINKISDETGIMASYNIKTIGTSSITAGYTGEDFSINGVLIGRLDVKHGDLNGALVQSINSVKNETSVEASVDSFGKLVLTSLDGRGIVVKDSSNGIFGIASLKGTQACFSDVNNFKATKDGGIIINGEKIDGANNVEDFIKNVNKLSNKTQVIAILENNRIKFLSLDSTKMLDISGTEVVSNLGLSLGTVKGDWVDKDSYIVRPSTNTPDSLALLVQYEGESEAKWTSRIPLEGKSDGKYTLTDIVNCFNKASAQTGITAFLEENDNGQQRLCFNMPEGVTTIKGISTSNLSSKPPNYQGSAYDLGFGGNQDRYADGVRLTSLYENYGQISFIGSSASDIQISVIKDGIEQNNLLGIGEELSGFAQTSISLKEMIGGLDSYQKQALGFLSSSLTENGLNLKKAMALMEVSKNAISDLGKIRSDIGSAQNQLQSTINNINITQIALVNSASNIEDLDFAQESITYKKYSILSQSSISMLYKTDFLKSKLFSMLFKY
ncbi:hypothetical protein KJK83_000937 [Campylobacter jejuni]|nr:hypothetical protein [Campylobacter jejuni]EHN6902271.1 hypothetical protein [Campylobacter jejuni]EHN6915874.1 hypothetical protein [Campylobacter jejuni]